MHTGREHAHGDAEDRVASAACTRTSARGPFAAFATRAWRWLPAPLLPLWLRAVEPARRDLGPLGERLAALHLARRGLRLLARNARALGVEIDLVVEDGDRPVLVEVKTSRCRADLELGAARFRPLDRIGPARIERLGAAGRRLSARSGRPTARVDAIEVWIAGPRRRVTVRWHAGVGASVPGPR